MNRNLLAFLMLCLTVTTSSLFAQTVITDASINAGDNITWTADTEYLLDGFVYVEAGATLNIEAGTVIKAREIPSSNDLASTLVIARGGTINAIGTSDAPIIFTTELDDVEDATDLAPTDRGLWGGLILLGNATIVNDGQLEEVVEGLPADDARSLFGGNDDNDSSGRISFISIRHGGAELAPGEEINGLTLGAVGSATQIDHVEVYANSDDGIEWFGGTVDVKYAAVSFCGDDAFDWDLGWRGRGQYFFGLTGDDDGDNSAEMDGAKPDAGTPPSNPYILNATYIGAGQGAAAKNEHALLFRDGSQGTYANSIFTDGANYCLQVEDRASGTDSYQYFQAGQLQLQNNIFWAFGEGNELNTSGNGCIQVTEDAEDPTAADLVSALAAMGNVAADPMIGGISRTQDGALDPRPNGAGSAYDDGALAAIPTDDFYTPSSFKGAFCDDGVWVQKWTALAHNNVLGANVPFTGNANCDVMTSVDFIIEENGYLMTQNYPNPVVDNTEIMISLPETTAVSLTVYTMDGKVVANIYTNDRLAKGDHVVTFDASHLAHGMYYYSLETANATLTKAMIKR